MQPVNKNSFITTLLIATSILGGGALYNQTASLSKVFAATTETTQALVYNVAVSSVGVLALLSLLIAWFKRQHV